MPHLERERVSRHTPVFVTLRVGSSLPNLREGQFFRAVQGALQRGCARMGMRLVHYSVQHNHLHLLVEARDGEALARGMQGLAVRIARALNRVCERRGRVFADRYHCRVLRSPRAVRHALVYVLNNARKHARQRGRSKPAGWVDSRSSALAFDGWRRARGDARRPEEVGIVAPRTWLLSVGWRRGGLLRIDELPGMPKRLPGARAGPRVG